jgi:hypothetical protein
MNRKSPLSLAWFALNLALIAGLTALGPMEKSLGANVRVVYLHGAWVWTSLACFTTAGLAGLAGLVFWITYLPLSIWAMQTNWNGLFLAEPRWRLGIVFATGGLVLQIVLALVEAPVWASAGNLLYVLALFYSLGQTQQIMHPGSPIDQSGSLRIQLFFAGLVLLCLLAAWQVAWMWMQLERGKMTNDERRMTSV